MRHNTHVLTYTLSFIDRTEESLQSSKTRGDTTGVTATSQNKENKLEKKPEVKDLMQKLKTLIEWYKFAENLPKIEQHHIKKIKYENKGDIDEQKRALFNKWLAIYPGAKYSDVVEALKTAGETTLADDVRNWLGDGGQATQMSTRIEETDSR